MSVTRSVMGRDSSFSTSAEPCGEFFFSVKLLHSLIQHSVKKV